ncbi:porin [Ramlibacter sp. WS9]|uniref:porin n=1 Tax=Ramlibacter sp. WS9 TaxID=1882741 RepID=UPI0011437DDD|nr:porin [Ramlibacter sp. WS9]ROZ66057.1 porin [Ramlibacter sp. WS9]
MKFRLTAAAALTVLAGLAHAQSSVTLFGVVDTSLKSVSNGGVRSTQLSTDGLSNSRLGFRAEEDLGGGMKAGAWLEAALNPDTGSINASGKFWHRRSTVSLSDSWGELRLGRDLNPSFWNLSIFDPFGTCGVGSGFNLVTNLGSGAQTLLRTDNAVAYLLPSNLGGLYGHFMLAPSEGVAGNKYKGGRLGYQSGPLNVAAAYATTATATADDFKLVNVGVSYDLKAVKLFALNNTAKYGAKKQVNWEIGLTAPVGGTGLVRASYQRADASGAGTDANDARQIAIGYVHNLSIRTALYASASHVRNSGAAAYAVGTPPAGVPGSTSRGYELGVRHTF